MGGGPLEIRILGCGSSGGVPRIGPNWGNCDPGEPRNRRLRCSILVQRFAQNGEATSVLVDTSPDMREQLLAARIGRLDAVLFTHDHADQAHGIDDLRQICYVMRKRVPVYMDAPTTKTLTRRFDYCFEQAEGSGYPAILEAQDMPEPGTEFQIDGPGGPISITPIDLEHGPTMRALGFRFDNIAYAPDVSSIPKASRPLFEGLDLWIVDALRQEPHPTHAHLGQTLAWIEQAKPTRSILTNMHITLDYATLKASLPQGIEPAYDGMVVRI
ncbi:MAG: phosphoribosyl 1,2-cyclic phosphodiesterase [Robiginitomaculum sp.]|nr:MAG: phosphoribosyl 1,2-cyclic phosphodiesterase [Robiginitomaculum sp.]